LVVSPHPDDETLGAGGLIGTWHRRGHRVTILSLTDGEAAHVDWPGLRRVRRSELDAALACLCGTPVTVIRLQIPDGRVGSYRGRVTAAIRALSTRHTTLIGPYEADGHPDHDASGAICLATAREVGIALARYPIWLWHRCDTAVLQQLEARRFWLDPQTQCTKGRAAQCFVSQLQHFGRAPPIVPAHVIPYFARPYETFFV
jgi:LmbE family N-acetylglucosaminyl deacetylase